MGVWGFGLVNNGFYFAEDEDTMAEDTEDRSGSLEVEDDDTEELVEKITNVFKQLNINVFDNLEND